MNKKVKTAFLSWLGEKELRADKPGIAKAIKQKEFDEVHLFGNLADGDLYTTENYQGFKRRIESAGGSKVVLHTFNLDSPTDLTGIYNAVHGVITTLKKRDDSVKLYYHMNSGTAPMIAIWIILSKTKYQGELIETHFPRGREPENLIKIVEVPFELTAEFISDLNHQVSLKIASDLYESEFKSIIHRCDLMKNVVRNAKLLAIHDVNTLIEGETGTGKELFARAIHDASTRKKAGGKFVAFNCGAFPENLIESHLFGYVKGAFSGAAENRSGLFHEANNGTLFLDEIGEAPKKVQVQLLRAIQENTVMRVGSTKEENVNVRVIAATNRNLRKQIVKGEFREDLYYRLAVGTIKLPPLREREGDLVLLINQKFASISKELNLLDKKISISGKNFLMNYSWPGNVRELENTLKRALIWSESTQIALDDIQKAILPPPRNKRNVMNLPIGKGFSLKDLLSRIRSHYIKRALKQANDNEAEAGKLLGFGSGGKLIKYYRKKNHAR